VSVEQSVILSNATGLHARPAGLLAKTAGQFKSQVEVKAKNRVVNAKSIVSLLSLGLEKGDELTFVVAGEDEEAALDSLVALVNRQFE
jgi:phosphocarrier protein HPr